MQPKMSDPNVIAALQSELLPLGQPKDGHTTQERKLDALLHHIGDASFVLLGEATHGTLEFYRLRMRISQRLIAEQGFSAIAVEADWPDALAVNRYVKGEVKGERQRQTHGGQHDAAQTALGAFRRFPLWMWRNPEIVQLIAWLHEHNRSLPAERRVGFFGLDLYSLRSAMAAVIQYLAHIDPDAAQRARERYACFDHAIDHPQQYGYAATFGTRPDCEQQVLEQLVAMHTDVATALQDNMRRDDSQHRIAAEDELFYAQQNARVACSAEAYYRAMFGSRNASWNLRDTHMAQMLDALHGHLGRHNLATPAKLIIWAHNSHIGDARATELGEGGQCNLGQLVRERRGEGDTYLLGFTTHTGSVTAASEWEAPPEHKRVLSSRKDSVERLLHDTGCHRFFLPLRGRQTLHKTIGRRLERAIGVLYLPETERWSHYFHADIARQFDGVVHIDTTHALPPLDPSPRWRHHDLPDTYPWGM